MPHYIELSDSSAAQTRALATALEGRHFDPFSLDFVSRTALRLLDYAPREIVDAGVGLVAARLGIPPRAAGRISVDRAARWVAGRYGGRADFPAVLLGAPNGGVSHIGTALGAPFLTTHFLYCFRHVKHADDIGAFFSLGLRAAKTMTKRNPCARAVLHYDPVHDRPPLAFVTHVRMKLDDVPAAYAGFVADRTPPATPLIAINCTYSWPQYRPAPRVAFQVGGLGGVEPEEFLDGGPRVREWLRERRSPIRRGWRLGGGFPLAPAPESEWGLAPGFLDALKDFARASGRRLITLTADHPERFSELAFLLHRRMSERDGEEPLFVFVDCFNHLDPFANLRSRALPLWAPYYDRRSFEFVRRIIGTTGAETRALFTMHPSFSEPFDMTPLGEWLEMLTREQPPVLLGLDPRRFPWDVSYVYSFGRDVRDWSEMHVDEVRSRATPEDVIELAPAAGIDVEIRE